MSTGVTKLRKVRCAHPALCRFCRANPAREFQTFLDQGIRPFAASLEQINQQLNRLRQQRDHCKSRVLAACSVTPCCVMIADKKTWSEFNSLKFKVMSTNARSGGSDNLAKLNSVPNQRVFLASPFPFNIPFSSPKAAMLLKTRSTRQR